VLQAHSASDATKLISQSGGRSTSVVFINNLDVVATIYWINYDGGRQHYMTLSPGQSYKQHTYVDHPWLVCAGSEQLPIAVFHPSQNDGHALIIPSLLDRNTTSGLGDLKLAQVELEPPMSGPLFCGWFHWLHWCWE
jgi:hypothetical protein